MGYSDFVSGQLNCYFLIIIMLTSVIRVIIPENAQNRLRAPLCLLIIVA